MTCQGEPGLRLLTVELMKVFVKQGPPDPRLLRLQPMVKAAEGYEILRDRRAPLPQPGPIHMVKLKPKPVGRAKLGTAQAHHANLWPHTPTVSFKDLLGCGKGDWVLMPDLPFDLRSLHLLLG